MIKQAVALPFRFGKDGALEVLLVTTRGKGRWILPKGKIDQGWRPAETAAAEAFEEAGVSGAILEPPIAESIATGWGRVSVHAIQVERVLDEWPEMGQRERRWVAIDDGVEMVNDKGLQQLLNRVATEGF